MSKSLMDEFRNRKFNPQIVAEQKKLKQKWELQEKKRLEDRTVAIIGYEMNFRDSFRNTMYAKYCLECADGIDNDFIQDELDETDAPFNCDGCKGIIFAPFSDEN